MSEGIRSEEESVYALPLINQADTADRHITNLRFSSSSLSSSWLFLADLFNSAWKLSWSLASQRRSIILPITVICFPLLLFVFAVSFQRHTLNQGSYSVISHLNSSITHPFFDCSEAGFAHTKIPQYHTESDATSSCNSKHQQHCFRKHKAALPSTFLNVVRDYERFHQRCTQGYDLNKFLLKGKTPKDCKYLVWKSLDGLGNQIVSITSAYIYSLLTRRVLLILTDSNVQNLFCEPFPHSSWLAPKGFPGEEVRKKSKRIGVYFSDVLKLKRENASILSALDHNQSIPGAPNHLHAIITCCDIADHQFFCPTGQKLLANTRWLFFYSHEYSVPGFYFIPQFRNTLNQWFPDKSVFMHTARYLFNPENRLWTRIRNLYDSQFGGVDRLLGIQVRAWKSDYHPIISKQVLQCGIDKGLLPRPLNATNDEKQQQHAIDHTRSKASLGLTNNRPGALAVLLASLRPEYYQDLSHTYMKHQDPNGGPVSIFSASQEGFQKTGNLGHDEKALIDIWLLSFMEDLIITPASTFGSVPSGFSGIVPLLFNRYGEDEEKLPEPVCDRSNLPGPCFIRYPQNIPCDLDPPESRISDPGDMIHEIKYCLLSYGIGIYQG